MDIRSDIKDILYEKGYLTDSVSIDKVEDIFEDLLIKSGHYWDYLEQAIEDTELSEQEVNLNTIEKNKEYIIGPVETIKKSLHNKKVLVTDVKNTVYAVVLEGRLKNREINIDPKFLQEIKK